MDCRAPQGARGLKSMGERFAALTWRSRPARGAWVEMMANASLSQIEWLSRPARGAWVEIKRWAYYTHAHRRRAPQGARGLKSELPDEVIDAMLVAPRKGRVG